MADQTQNNGMDAFSAFWRDYMSRLGAAGMSMPQTPDPNEGVKQMQRMFLDAMAKYADDFMRSPQFLEMMRQNMENALSFRRQLDEFMAQALNQAQAPSRSDVDELIKLVKGVEERMMERVDALEDRLGETGGTDVATPRTAPKRTTAKTTRK